MSFETGPSLGSGIESTNLSNSSEVTPEQLEQVKETEAKARQVASHIAQTRSAQAKFAEFLQFLL